MSWFSKVVWSEGLFLRPHHLQQHDRYVERLLETRVRQVTPYPWGFSALEIDHDLARQSRFALRRAAGVLPDGTPFDLPGDSPLPPAIDVPDGAAGQTVWLSLPLGAPNTREADSRQAGSASRWLIGTETIIDSTADLRQEEEIDVALPRLAFELRKARKPGTVDLAVARIAEIQDKALLFDAEVVPPLLVIGAHPTVVGWLDRVLGWVETCLSALARFAVDPTAGGGFQQDDYFVLQLLNRTYPVLRHLRASAYVHPERLYEDLLRLAGELSTFSDARRVRDYPPYDHDDLAAVFEPVLRDIQDYLSLRFNRRVRRLELVQIAANAYEHRIRDRSIFQDATFVLEVAADRPLPEIQGQFPALFKVAPSNRMRDLIQSALPGVPLMHRPTPPPQIRAISDHVYFILDRKAPMWTDFSAAASIAMHFTGDWPGLELDFWAVLENRR